MTRPQVLDLLAKTRRACVKRGALPHKKDALTKDRLRAVLATCDETLRGKRDRAPLLIACPAVATCRKLHARGLLGRRCDNRDGARTALRSSGGYELS